MLVIWEKARLARRGPEGCESGGRVPKPLGATTSMLARVRTNTRRILAPKTRRVETTRVEERGEETRRDGKEREEKGRGKQRRKGKRRDGNRREDKNG